MWTLRNPSWVSMRPLSTSAPHWPACWARRLVREQVVEVCQPSQQRLLAATGMSDDVQMVKIQWCVKEQNQRECFLWG
jgi:hypothetical protein